MKPFEWDQEKNGWLKNERSVSFEPVVFSIENGKLLDIIKPPNPARYKGQCLYVVEIEGYVYMVPYIEDDDVIFLETISPSRKYTNIYLQKERK